MTYKAVEAARKAAEARSGNVKDAVRLGLKMKKELDLKKHSAAMTSPKPEATEGGAHEKGTADVIAERRRQTEVEGWTPAHDDQHTDGALAKAATCYASVYPLAGSYWPWDISWWKPTDRRRNLVKAAALLIAEIERIDRAAPTPQPVGSEKEGGNDV